MTEELKGGGFNVATQLLSGARGLSRNDAITFRAQGPEGSTRLVFNPDALNQGDGDRRSESERLD